MDQSKLKQLLGYLEENIRSSDQTAGTYIDPHGNIERLNSKQNQIIFGRRGSGKSLLIKALKTNSVNEAIYTKVNIEDYKDISFPDSILQVLNSFLKQLINEVENDYKFYQLRRMIQARGLTKKLKSIINENKRTLREPDRFDKGIVVTDNHQSLASAEIKSNIGSIKVGEDIGAEVKTTKTFLVDKLSNLKKDIPNIKELIILVSKYFNGKHIFLVLDDFYFLKRQEQPFFIDYFHRLTKDTPLYLKVATIRFRSSLYTTAETYIGIEIGHDAQSIELDYTLDKFKVLEDFMWEVLQNANTTSNAKVDLDSLISNNAFKYLCLASGGVVRDFLSLFLKVGEEINKGKTSISKPDVIEIAISNIQNKFDALETDSADEKEELERYLNYVKNFLVTEKRTNICLIGLQDIERFPNIKQSIKELVDLRLLHQVEPNISAKQSDGQRYSAYMIDVGLFPGPRPKNFHVIEPGNFEDDKKNDEVRSAPKLDLDLFNKNVESKE